MSNVKKLKIGSTDYDIVDATAAHSLTDIAIAGNNITFTTPSNIDNVASGDKVSSPTISSSGIFTPTGTSQYIYFTSSSIPNYTGSIFTGNYSWSWTFKFKSPADVTETHTVCRAGNSRTNFNLWCALSEGSSIQKRLNFAIHLSNNTWSNEAFSYQGGATDLEPNTWYWIRISRDYVNSLYKLELSTDGTTWTTEVSFTSTYGFYNSNSSFYLSNYYSSSDAGIDEYDLTGCSFTSNYSTGIDWVAYIADDRTTISSTCLQNTASGTDSLGILNGSTVGNYSTALGKSAQAANYSTALGYQATAGGTNSIAISCGSGTNPKAETTQSQGIAIGYQTKSKATAAVAIGSYSQADTYGSYSVAIGASDSDSNKALVSGSYCIAIGYKALAGSSAYTHNVAIGYQASANGGDYGLALGYNAQIGSGYDYAIQIGPGTNSTANSLSVGLSSSNNYTLLESDGTIPDARLKSDVLINTATGTKCLTVGGTASASDRSTNVGIESIANGVYSSAFGRNAVTSGNFSVAVGAGAATENGAKNSIAIGCDARISANVENAILLGKLATSSESNTFKVAFASGNTTAVDESTGLYTLLDGTTGKVPTGRIYLEGVSDPTTSTAGTVGRLYENTTSGELFKCAAIDTTDPNNPVYTWTKIVENTATATNSISVPSNSQTDTNGNSLNIGYSSGAKNGGIAIGYNSKAGNSASSGVAIGSSCVSNGYNSTAIGKSAFSSAASAVSIGDSAQALADNAIQVGRGTNSTAHTLSIGLSSSDNYTLLNSDGTIPGPRMALQGSGAPTTSTAGTVGQFYIDTTNEDAYICVSDASSTYIWKKITP